MTALILIGFIGLIQAIVAFIAIRRQTDNLVGLAHGGIVLIVVWWLYLFRSDTWLIATVLVILITTWSVRIGIYLFLRWLSLGRDKRFDGVRDNPRVFVKFHIFQWVFIFLLLLPVMRGMQHTWEMFWYGWVGMGIALFGIILETIADRQKFRFKHQYPTRWCDRWLRARAKFPNYFGEMLVWWWIYLICLCVLQGWQQWVGIIGPFSITWLLLFVTGIPPLEKDHNNKRWKDKERQYYQAHTNLLLPISR